MDVELVFSAFTMDVVSEYAMGKSYGNLDMEDFNKHYHGIISKMGTMWHLSKQFPWLPGIFEALPASWIRKMVASASAWKDLKCSVTKKSAYVCPGDHH